MGFWSEASAVTGEVIQRRKGEIESLFCFILSFVDSRSRIFSFLRLLQIHFGIGLESVTIQGIHYH